MLLAQLLDEREVIWSSSSPAKHRLGGRIEMMLQDVRPRYALRATRRAY
jgi:hypothetical protein